MICPRWYSFVSGGVGGFDSGIEWFQTLCGLNHGALLPGLHPKLFRVPAWFSVFENVCAHPVLWDWFFSPKPVWLGVCRNAFSLTFFFLIAFKEKHLLAFFQFKKLGITRATNGEIYKDSRLSGHSHCHRSWTFLRSLMAPNCFLPPSLLFSKIGLSVSRVKPQI